MSVNNAQSNVKAEYSLLVDHHGDDKAEYSHDRTNPLSNSSSSKALQVHSDSDHKNKLGTLNGCYVPCLLNIMGIILFERLGWGIGQVGVSGVFLIFLIAESQAIITVLSLCAIVTNGNMKGGGSYYMISRTLGPEFGGSIGILFYAAYAVGVAFYASGFAEEVVSTWFADSDNQYWLINAFSSLVLLICLVIAMIGAECFTKINVILFAFQFLAIFIALIACFFRGTFALQGQTSPCLTDGEPDGDFKHYTWSFDRLSDTWAVSGSMSFAATFGVLFPAATGIMEGANLSGDLANPTYSIPAGTLAAIGTSIVFYILLIIAFAGSFNECTLREDTTIMQEAAWGEFGTYLVVTGIIISASSSALGSLFGGSRVLQAIARDKLFPYTRWFEYGSPDGDEPRTAVLLTWLLAQGLVFVGGIDVIAPISTSFFCLSYATVNLSCFLLAISGTPNFRPSFTWYSWHSALLGTLSNLAVMFYVDWRFGVMALSIEMGIFAFLVHRAPQNVWGDVTQSILFHQVRKYLLKLDERQRHIKHWRPSLLLLADDEDSQCIDFCNNLKKGGLYIIGATLRGQFGDFAATTQLKKDWVEFIDANELKAFPQISVAPTLRAGLESLVLLSGLGALQPNTVLLPLIKTQRDAELELSAASAQLEIASEANANAKPMQALVPQTPAALPAAEYVALCRSILRFDRNVVVTANFHAFDDQLLVSAKMHSDFADRREVAMEMSAMDELSKSADTAERDASADGDDDDAFLSATVQHDVVVRAPIPLTRDSSQWIDVWLFARDYSLRMERLDENRKDGVFPMLLLQLAHILLRNKVWSRRAGARLRVLLFVDNRWAQSDQQRFEATLKELRLNDIAHIEILKEPEMAQRPSWAQLAEAQGDAKQKAKQLRQWWNALNSTMKSLSSQTYFTFLKLPELPPQRDDDTETDARLSKLYAESLYVLLRGLPPTALVATGEVEPVISVDL